MISIPATVLCDPMTDPSRSSAPGAFPAGWFPDPLGRYEHRWFNGTTWTSDVSTDGQRYVDPLGIAGGPSIGGQTAPEGNGPATAAITCGIIGMLLACLPFVFVVGAALGVLALVFGVKGRRRARENGRGGSMAVAGVVTGALALGLCVVGVITSVITFREVVAYAEPGLTTVTVDECVIDGRSASVTGTLTNESAKTRDYTLFVTVDDTRTSVVIDDVAPDATVEWQATITDDVIVFSCEPDVIVNGPFPFGLEMEPVEP
jgi:hypothetical protein